MKSWKVYAINEKNNTVIFLGVVKALNRTRAKQLGHELEKWKKISHREDWEIAVLSGGRN